jgi:hypothetical protein
VNEGERGRPTRQSHRASLYGEVRIGPVDAVQVAVEAVLDRWARAGGHGSGPRNGYAWRIAKADLQSSERRVE